MASTITIGNTLDWVSAFVVQRPTTGVAGVPNEPGLTAANLVMQSMMAAPFRWNWNRAENSTIVATAGTTDYVVALADWGWLEKASIFLATNDPPTFELEIAQVLAKDTQKNRPQKIAPVLDDGAGNITFRLFPAPDQAWTVTLTYQKSPVLATALVATTWTPIPDRYAFIYERGMLAHMQGIYSPQLYALNLEIFFRQLVGAAEGLTETERAIFLEEKLRQLRTQEVSAINVTQGRQARL